MLGCNQPLLCPPHPPSLPAFTCPIEQVAWVRLRTVQDCNTRTSFFGLYVVMLYHFVLLIVMLFV